MHPVVLHAARLLDIKNGRIVKPGEVLVQREAEVIDLGDSHILPGLIDAHVHLFLHPGTEDLQTVQESVPQRTITALLAAMTAYLLRSQFRDATARGDGF